METKKEVLTSAEITNFYILAKKDELVKKEAHQKALKEVWKLEDKMTEIALTETATN